MKTLYLVGGTMGVGKTSVCRHLKMKLQNSVFLDGDWCWDAHPFTVTEETKAMVLNNICFLLNQFLHCSAYDHVIFCWVLHEQSILDTILARLDTTNCKVKPISLLCSEAELKARLLRDVADGIRTQEVVARSVARLPLYSRLNTIQIDTTGQTPAQVAEEIVRDESYRH